ncbi:MAG: hypothetical protein Q8Q81_08355, partial [Oxalobacteraceae bacterium]|nr:hypothetical protein [Oxalobacteraceae bacterium]
SSAALSGGSNFATALSLNACPYRAISVLHRRPLGWSIEATTILTRGGTRNNPERFQGVLSACFKKTFGKLSENFRVR